jgi:hypothetical protein
MAARSGRLARPWAGGDSLNETLPAGSTFLGFLHIRQGEHMALKVSIFLRATFLALFVLATNTRAEAAGSLTSIQAEPSDKAINDVLFSATGRLYLSVDGGGSTGSSYTVQVQKPSSSATVRRAFFLAASVGGQNYVIPNGTAGIRLGGVGISWGGSIPSGINSWNHKADITSIIKPAIDGSAATRLSFTVEEGRSDLIDGTVLAIVFDDPSQTSNSTVTLLFGAQQPLGDNFSIALANPIQPTSAGARLTMGLGISYGAQDTCANGIQFSRIEVNGTRLTSSAGGEDDGSCQDGALITVGGLDDSIANPPSPFAGPGGNPRTDDELYSLLPFITGSTTQVGVTTLNPSNDDNIFFAHFQISGSATVSTGGCTPSAIVLCIDDQPNDRRFKAEIGFSTSQGGGTSGIGQAIPLSSLGVSRGGLFWFFGPDNPEMLIKVLNGCAVNNHYWVFYSAGTNVGFALGVTDTVTGRIFRSSNPDLRVAPPVAATSAIPCT